MAKAFRVKGAPIKGNIDVVGLMSAPAAPVKAMQMANHTGGFLVLSRRPNTFAKAGELQEQIQSDHHKQSRYQDIEFCDRNAHIAINAPEAG
jgi:hypothetical protein